MGSILADLKAGKIVDKTLINKDVKYTTTISSIFISEGKDDR